MSESKDKIKQDNGPKKTLTLSKKLDPKKNIDPKDQVRQSFSHGRSKTVEVEVKRRRLTPAELAQERKRSQSSGSSAAGTGRLTDGEFESRMKALQQSLKETDEKKLDVEKLVDATPQETVEIEVAPLAPQEVEAPSQPTPPTPPITSQEPRATETPRRENFVRPQQRRQAPSLEKITPIVLRAEGYKTSKPTAGKPTSTAATAPTPHLIDSASALDPQAPRHHAPKAVRKDLDTDEDEAKKSSRVETKKVAVMTKKGPSVPKRLDRNFLSRALDENQETERKRSVAALKRARQKHKGHDDSSDDAQKIVRDVIIPESITVGELSNRMAVRAAEIVKSLMKLGMMVTINQMIDADTAELICTEFGHTAKRVSDADIEIGIKGNEDRQEDMRARAPVVTVMGHVDHGKTSLLDALRQTDVVSGEAGGITQHIGAYQVTLKSGKKITFIDTPGHAAFSEMRARGANITDVVVLVVAADDGIKEQTIEAINHAKAAQVPIVVAINKIDKPEANADRVRSELLQHGLVLEEFGGEILGVEVSAKKGFNLEKLEEAILLQSEILDLKANPSRTAQGVIIEARMEKGRGTVSTVLIQKGTLRVGDVFVAGTEFGRVRALVSDHGTAIKEVLPGMPVEVLGFNGIPAAGDEFIVVEDESKAREISDYRVHRKRELQAVKSARGTMEQMMSKIASGEAGQLAIVVKTDVQGSLEAISASLSKLATEEVSVRVLHGAVGGINESDVTLAQASNAIIIGFNVRANPQARELARRDNVDIRYYSIIYDVIDDMKAVMSGLLAPTLREKYIGQAEIRTVFSVGKLGKIAGCYVTEGQVKRGAKVRLLRDNVVIFEGELKMLKRFKDDVKEVKESYECGISFENYNDIKEKDVIECFEIESVSRQLS